MKRTPMARALCALAAAACLLVAAEALCDAVKLTSGLVYDPVTVTDVDNGQITFRTLGSQPSKPLGELAGVTLTGQNRFNAAEELFAKGKYDEAAAAYLAAATAAGKPWQKRLIQYRRMAALAAGGEIDEALKLWLAMVDAAGVTKGTLDLRPRKLPPAGSKANDRAVALLEGKAKQVSSATYRGAILLALAELHERQGRIDQSGALRAGLSTSGGRPTARKLPTVVPRTSSANTLLRSANSWLKQGECEKVADAIKKNLNVFRTADLPSALYLLGRAQSELAKREKDPKAARELLLRAGLNLMRTVVFFPASDEAPHALLSAGEVNERLGNLTAARSAFSAVVSGFSGSPAAEQATAALKRTRQEQD